MQVKDYVLDFRYILEGGNKMKLIVAEDFEEMSQVSSEIVLGVMHQNGRVNIAPTTGTTPVGLYKILNKKIKDKDYFDHVHYYSFDETPYKVSQKEGRIMTNLREMFLTPANINEKNIHPLNQHNFMTRDQELADFGGLDLVILGLGKDGHFCCNFPGYAKFSQKTVEIPLTGKLYELYKGVFADKEEIPDALITMGPSAILASKQLLLMVSGKEKAEACKQALFGEITEEMPGSILRTHPNITIIVDQEAASLF